MGGHSPDPQDFRLWVSVKHPDWLRSQVPNLPEVETLEVPVLKRDSFRIAVGRPGHRGEIWKVWKGWRKSDVYLGARSAPEHKYSFHESGRWRSAFESDVAAAFIKPGQDRALDKWQRPAGNTAALAIFVRDVDLFDPQDDDDVADVVWVPEPQPGHLVAIGLLFIEPDDGAVLDLGGTFLVAMGLPNGTIVMAVASHQPYTAEGFAPIEMLRQRALQSVPMEARQAGNRLAIMASKPDTGVRHLYDTAIQAGEAPA